jgi:hypothetical protein
LRVQLLGEIHHDIGIVLLVARACTSEKSTKGGDRYLIALRATSSGVTCSLPLRRRIGDDLRNAFVEMCRSGSHGPGRSESEKESG